mgnify:CR=1 FL=1|tara:strand:- start:641 stop:1999 length:1359 start_codon:yes stop_codon:yes gene_type:complete
MAELPKICYVKRRYDCPEITEGIDAIVVTELNRIFEGLTPQRGARIGICAGSRGIANLQKITLAAVEGCRALGLDPVILPAMGSHGGATAAGQTEMLADPTIGIDEASMGCAVDARMDTFVVDGPTEFPIHWSVAARECDHVLVINRVKPHTEIFGRPAASDMGMEVDQFTHSGVLKMLAVGLGKQLGAQTYHQQIPSKFGLGGAIMLGAKHLVERYGCGQDNKVVGGLAIVENSLDRTAKIEAIPFDASAPQEAFERELELLAMAQSWMPQLPSAELDVLWIQQMGKRISGTGMDTNVLNRNPYGYRAGERWREEGGSIFSVVCSSLQSSSHGNAHGMGLADFITKRLESVIHYEATQVNSLTAFSPLLCSRPPVMLNDREAILAAINAGPAVGGKSPAFSGILDTLHPGEAFVSEAVLQQLDANAFEFPMGQDLVDMPFDADGYLNVEWR